MRQRWRLCSSKAKGERWRRWHRFLILHIEEHFDQPLSVGRIASHVGISRRQLERLFRAHLDLTVMDTVRLLRVHSAQEQLRVDGRRILDVAMDCGFNSHSTFNRAYRTAFGRNPARDRLDFHAGAGWGDASFGSAVRRFATEYENIRRIRLGEPPAS